MHEQSPTRTVYTGAPESPHRIVERVWNVVEAEIVLSKELFVDGACYLWTVGVVHRPAMTVSVVRPQDTNHSDHIVPMTLLNPQKSIEAAR
jgi:hypothetical protein